LPRLGWIPIFLSFLISIALCVGWIRPLFAPRCAKRCRSERKPSLLQTERGRQGFVEAWASGRPPENRPAETVAFEEECQKNFPRWFSLPITCATPVHIHMVVLQQLRAQVEWTRFIARRWERGRRAMVVGSDVPLDREDLERRAGLPAYREAGSRNECHEHKVHSRTSDGAAQQVPRL
jgi:hypothetical protein